jgi:cold shock CspA family protein
MYYVTTGKWKNDSNVLARVEASVTKLKSTDLFRDIIFSPVDSERLKKIYRELKHKIENEILFERHTILPTMEKVREAYIGIIPVSEFMKIIMDEDGNLRKHLFYDNVRDYQGNNSVNREISETLKDSVQNDKFALMNNGLTIVAKSINKVGAKFKLKDYQIVNGCQTTHVLFRNRDFLNDQVYLPIKLIVTDDIETTNLIIKATNRQTEVKIEAFESLSPFHKKLEEFYTTFGATRNPHLYYERRSKQYDHLPIGKNYIISLTAQVKSFISMFLNEPQSTHRYYGELLNSYRNRIFVENHSPFPYYLSGYAYNKVERYFAENKLNRRYKKFKYHLLLLFRLQSEPFNVPFLDSKKIDSYCDHLLRELSDEEKSLLIFKKSIKLIDETVKQAQISYNASTRRRAFTERLLNQLNGKQTLTSAKVRLMEGSITSFSRVKGYGLIRSKNIKEDIIFYNHDLSSADVDGINLNSVVKFNLVENSVGSFAKNITILKE